MKYIYVTILVLFFCITDAFAINFYPGSYKEALIKAKTEHKNLLLYFTATWCGPCQYMQQNIFPDREITKYVDANYLALKIDIDAEAGKRLYFKFEHQGVPDFYIITPDELILKRQIGGMKVNQLKSFLAVENAAKNKSQVLPDSVATILLVKAEKTIADFAMQAVCEVLPGKQLFVLKPAVGAASNSFCVLVRNYTSPTTLSDCFRD